MIALGNPRTTTRLEPSSMPFRPHPLTPKRPAGQSQPFFPSSFLPALQEDPQSRALDGWLVDGDELSSLAAQSDTHRSVHLVLGDPSAESLDLILDQLEANTLLLLPPLASLSTEAVTLLKRQPRQHRSQRSLVRHLDEALTSPTAISALLTQAAEYAVRWKLPSTRKTSARLGMMIPSAKQKSRQDRDQDDQSQQPFSPQTDPTLDSVVYFLPPPTDNSLLKEQLSLAFLITTASISLLSPKAFRRQTTTRSNLSTHRGSFSTPSPTPRSRSTFLSSDPSPSIDRSDSATASKVKSGSFVSFSEAGSSRSATSTPTPSTGPARMGMLVHILPTLARSPSSDGTFHAVFARSLDKFQQRFLEKNLAITMVTLPEEILQDSPVPAPDGLGRSSSWSSRLSIPEEEEESPKDIPPSPPMTTSVVTLTNTHNVISLIFSSAIKSPLPPLPSRSRRGSSSSLASRTSFQSISQYGSGPGLGYPALADVNSFLPSADAIMFIPSSTGSLTSSSASSAYSDHKSRHQADLITQTTFPSRPTSSIINLSRKQEKNGWIGRLFAKRERGC
ncbi:hypothetical protein [Phaffia rhodozyma]|uniref:Uncharacterized protein n=1 Tax=Phaffia rhodozyma TaxID=264483 RepID=A0A0F7SQH5_PHARH|nr:hypothetical protein [Phaffia rhodozyma]